MDIYDDSRMRWFLVRVYMYSAAPPSLVAEKNRKMAATSMSCIRSVQLWGELHSLPQQKNMNVCLASYYSVLIG